MCCGSRDSRFRMMSAEPLGDEAALVTELVGDQAGAWELSGELPRDLLGELGKRGLLCAEVGVEYGGLGASSLHNGEFTAHVGGLSSSLRSVMTSQGMAAWTIQRLGRPDQRKAALCQLTSGKLAAVGMSETGAGSDLSAMSTTVRYEGDWVVLDGNKVWVTGALYADLLVIFARSGNAGAVVAVPASAPGVHVERLAEPAGCRAAGHAVVRLESVRLPVSSVLGGGNQPLSMLVTIALAYGRTSVAWGCVGIARACVQAAVRHAKTRSQFGKPLAEHQLVARHLAEQLADEQVATRVCEHASRCWDSGSSEMIIASVLAKHVSAGCAARAATSAWQVLGSAAARSDHVVARAYQDAKLMEIIEGSNEMCQLMLAEHALSTI